MMVDHHHRRVEQEGQTVLWGSGNLSICGTDASGTLCAGCASGTFKYGKACTKCPSEPLGAGLPLYILMPLFLMFGFFPIFM